MSIFDSFRRKRKQNNEPTVTESYSFNGQSATLTGWGIEQKNITEEQILEIPAVQSSLELITSSIAQLPIKLYKRNSVGDYEEIVDDYRTELLNREANENITGYDFKKKIAKDILLYGTSKTKIEHKTARSNQITGLYPLDTKDLMIEVYLMEGYKRFAKVNLMSKVGTYTFDNDDLLSILKMTDNGITGTGILQQNAKLLALALAQDNYQTQILNNGAMPISVLESDAHLGNDQLTRLAESFKALYSGTVNAGKTILLEAGLKFKQASIDPDKLQITEGKKVVVSDIARIFNLPESMINSSANKYNSNEQNNLYFLQYTLSPIMVAIESSLNKSLLLETEKEGDVEFRFDPSALLKATTKEQTDSVNSRVKSGLLSNVQAMRALGIPVEDGAQEFYQFTTGQVLFDPEKHTILNPNTGMTLDSLTGEILQEGIKNTKSKTTNESEPQEKESSEVVDNE